MRARRGGNLLRAAGMLAAAGSCFALCGEVRKKLEHAEPGEGSWYRLKPTENPGAAFGLPIDPKLLTGIALGGLPVLIGWCYRESPLAAGLILGGGGSNLWERLRRGSVLDYLQFPKLPGKLGRVVYNLADLAIFTGTGAILLVSRDRRARSE